MGGEYVHYAQHLRSRIRSWLGWEYTLCEDAAVRRRVTRDVDRVTCPECRRLLARRAERALTPRSGSEWEEAHAARGFRAHLPRPHPWRW